MHEIPNFPFPSLPEPEPTPSAHQEQNKKTELKASPAKTEDSRSVKHKH
jgi:hypothetical protein